jgi:hypothetical protein
VPRFVARVLWDNDVEALRVVHGAEDAHLVLKVGDGKCAHCGEMVGPPPREGLVPYFVASDPAELWHWAHTQEFIERERSKQ